MSENVFLIFVEIFLVVAKIGEIELGEFPLLLAPMEDVSDPLFERCAKRMEQMSSTQSLFLVKA